MTDADRLQHASHDIQVPLGLTIAALMLDILNGMDAEQTIAEIECIERIFAEPDTKPLSSSDLPAANRRHDEMQANSPCFRLWQPYGICCRSEADAGLQLLRSSTAFPSSASISKSLRVPIRMWRPALTREALGRSPAVETGGADSGFNSVPYVAAITNPEVVLARRPIAEWTSDL